MSLPKQVEEAAELAEQIHARMFNPDADESDGATPSTEAADGDTSVPATEPEPETPATDPEELSFKERYLTLKGKYEAEVPRLSSELKELKQSIVERLGQQFQKSTEPEKTAAPPEAVDPELEKFREEYGEEYYRLLEKVTELKARKIVDEALKDKLEPFQQKVDSVEETQVKAAQQNFMEYLDSKVPKEKGDWRALWDQKDPKFVEFLAQPDPTGLYTYGQLVEAFNNNWDADRLAAVFNLYLDQQTPQAPQPPAQKAVTNPVAEKAKEAMVAPRRSTQHVAPVVEDKRIWTPEMMKDFQKADMRGEYDAATSAAMWADLMAAPKENRFRPN